MVLTRKKDDDKDSKDKVEDSTNTEEQIADFVQTCNFLQLLNFGVQEANSFSPRAEAKSELRSDGVYVKTELVKFLHNNMEYTSEYQKKQERFKDLEQVYKYFSEELDNSNKYLF